MPTARQVDEEWKVRHGIYRIRGIGGLPNWVSGNTKTKTYGKGLTVREHKEPPTLPTRGVLRKVWNARCKKINEKA